MCVEQRYILYTHDTLPYLGKSNDSLNRRHGGGERARSDYHIRSSKDRYIY